MCLISSPFKIRSKHSFSWWRIIRCFFTFEAVVNNFNGNLVIDGNDSGIDVGDWRDEVSNIGKSDGDLDVDYNNFKTNVGGGSNDG